MNRLILCGLTASWSNVVRAAANMGVCGLTQSQDKKMKS
jgi:hypothetical protein